MPYDRDQFDLRKWHLVGSTFRICLDSPAWRGVEGMTGPKPMVHNTDCQHTKKLTDADVSDSGWTSVLPRSVVEAMWAGDNNDAMYRDPNVRRVWFCERCCAKPRPQPSPGRTGCPIGGATACE